LTGFGRPPCPYQTAKNWDSLELQSKMHQWRGSERDNIPNGAKAQPPVFGETVRHGGGVTRFGVVV